MPSTSISVKNISVASYQLIRAITSARAKDSVYFTLKTYFFYFTPPFLQNTHISLSILQDISIKYSLSSIFLLFLSTTSLYTRSLSFFLPIFLLCCSLSLHQSLSPLLHQIATAPSSSKSQNPSTFLFHHHHKISTTTKSQSHTHSIAP